MGNGSKFSITFDILIYKFWDQSIQTNIKTKHLIYAGIEINNYIIIFQDIPVYIVREIAPKLVSLLTVMA